MCPRFPPTPTRNELINDLQWAIRSIGPVAAPREGMSAAAATVPTLPLLTPNQAHAVAALQTVRRLARKWGGDAKKKATEEKAAQRAAMMAAKKAVAEAAESVVEMEAWLGNFSQKDLTLLIGMN